MATDVNTQKQLLSEGIDRLYTQDTAEKTIKQIMKMAAPTIGVKLGELNKLKDFKYTHGRGWGEGPLDKSKEKVKNADKISAILMKVVDMIKLLRSKYNLDWIMEYQKALKEVEITLEVDTDEEKYPRKDIDFDLMDETFTNVFEQIEIINNNKEKLAEVAEKSEEVDFLSKSSYNKVIKAAYKITIGENIKEQIEEQKRQNKKIEEMFDNICNEDFMKEVENMSSEDVEKAIDNNPTKDFWSEYVDNPKDKVE